MNVRMSPPMRGLVWKETRQILPLVWMLLSVTALLLLIHSLTTESDRYAQAFLGALAPFILPAFLAAGSGAILIGQEKETRTLRWTAGLPIEPRDVYWAKMIVSVIGLLVMWVGCLVLSSALGLDWRTGVFQTFLADPRWLALLFWFLHTVYVLVCGHYTGWRFDNPLTSLMSMLPLVALPYLGATILMPVYLKLFGGYATDPLKLWMTFALTVPALLIVGGLSYRAMRRKLEPEVAPVLGDRSSSLSAAASESSLDAWCPPATSMPSPRAFRFPVISLLWQSIRHNPWIVTVLALMVVIGLGAVSLVSLPVVMADYETLVFVMVAIGFLGVSWLGVFAFAGDGAHDRLKFLADRGVSPTAVWWGRHWIGLTICAVGLLLFVLLQSQYADGTWSSRQRKSVSPSPSLLMLMFVVGCVYAASQWISQMLRILAGTTFLAPVLSAMLVGWLVSSPVLWGAGMVTIALCLLIPFAVTWWLMGEHADGRRGWYFWMVNVIGLVLIAVLPISHTLIAAICLPGISDARRAELISLASQYPEPSTSRSLTMVERTTPQNSITSYSIGNTMLSGKEVEEMLASNGNEPSDWYLWGASEKTPLTRSGFEYNLVAMCEYHVLQCWVAELSDGEQPGEEEANSESERLTGQWLSMLTQVARRMRASDNWLDQDFADAMEIYLTRTFSHPSMRPWLDREYAREAIALVSDFEGRVESRRRAVLLTWEKSLRPAEDGTNASWSSATDRDAAIPLLLPTVLRETARRRYHDITVDEVLAMLDAGAAGEPTRAHRERLHRWYCGTVEPFELGPYSDRMRATADANGAANLFSSYPAQNWFAPWEETARRLPALIETVQGKTERANDAKPANDPEVNDE